MKIETGTILGFQGSWSSGLAWLIVKDHSGRERHLNCENAATVRALDDAFGDVITPAHCVNQEAIRGKEIYYSVGDFGLLEAFTPVDEAGPELIEAFENGEGL